MVAVVFFVFDGKNRREFLFNVESVLSCYLGHLNAEDTAQLAQGSSPRALKCELAQ